MKHDPCRPVVVETVATYIHTAGRGSWRLPAEWECTHCRRRFPADQAFMREPYATVRAHLDTCMPAPIAVPRISMASLKKNLRRLIFWA